MIPTKEDKQRWYHSTLSHHSSVLFKSLIYEYDLTSETLKEVEFELLGDNESVIIARGYFAKKDRLKYFLDAKLLSQLPIRVKDKNQELKYNEDVVVRPLNPSAFRITPEAKIPVREMIDGFAPFSHQNPPEWLLLKFMSFSSIISQNFMCISTTSAFGKSSIFKLMDKLTDKCPVFKPRSIPGVLNQITGDGNMVMDEIQECTKDVKRIIEEFALVLGDGSPDYINGALKSANTKQRYDCHNQSVTFLYNLIDHYKNPEKDFFEVIFSNNKAINDRFLKFRFDGKLDERWQKDFNVPEIAEKNKLLYIDHAKTVAFLTNLKHENGYQRRFNRIVPDGLSNRHKMTHDNITWLIDLYCYGEDEYVDIVGFLNDSIRKYNEMVADLTGEQIYIPSGVLTGDDSEDLEDD